MKKDFYTLIKLKVHLAQ